MFGNKFSDKLNTTESKLDAARQQKLENIERNKALFEPWKPEKISPKTKEVKFIPYKPSETRIDKSALEKEPKPLNQTENRQSPEADPSKPVPGIIYVETKDFRKKAKGIEEKDVPSNGEKRPSIGKPENGADIWINTMIPHKGGKWSGEPGHSRWNPDPNYIPPDKHGTNPEHKTWQEILDEYGIDSIPFKDGYPDFSEICKGQVEIDDFTDKRGLNFTQADEKLAKQRGCTPEEVAKWREEHGYTWHECEDCRTMQKVPTEVHGNVSHSGGISVYKSQHKDT